MLFTSVLWTSPRLYPVSAAISRTERPWLRRAATLASSSLKRGRPSLLPLARALRSPALIRSGIRKNATLRSTPCFHVSRLSLADSNVASGKTQQNTHFVASSARRLLLIRANHHLYGKPTTQP